MSIAVSLALVVVFLIMNAFFVIAEFALVRVRKSQLELAIDEGKSGAKNAMRIAENVNAYLSACQLGITLASLALGWLGEPAISKLFEPLFNMLGLPEAAIVAISVAIGYFIMTTLHVVVGELIPKSFAIFATERWALRTATPLIWFYRITYPIMLLFNGITNAVVRLTGHDPANEHDVYTGEEIQLLIDESTESGLIDPEQNEFVDNIFDLGDKDAEAIMTPRMDVICVDLEDSLAENLQVIKQYKYTRYPVCRGHKDRIVGFVHVKDLYTMPQGSTVHDLNIRTIEAVPESMPIAKLLQVLQAKHTKIAVVIDEHGGTAGIVTMSDIIEQIVGKVDDEFVHDDDQGAVRMEDGSYLVEGTMPIDDLTELMGFTPDEANECETAAGLLLALFDRIPQAGDVVEIEHSDARETVHITFTVVMMDRLRIDKLRMAVQTTEKQGEDGE
ncbi:MAG TPA: HlyC/CorC family transporter [Candidatus Aphodovivens excrementavium]|nr:HlyC/CorC family transporter [Candidatus Aphodovivens excrementavium]